MNGRMKPTVGRLLNDARFSLAPGGEDVLRQGLIMLACYAVYDVSRACRQGREAVAMANGLFFMNLEKALGIFWEPWVQGRVSAFPPLMDFLVWSYQHPAPAAHHRHHGVGLHAAPRAAGRSSATGSSP